MQRESGEVVLFRGHPSWRSIAPYWLRGLLLMLVLGVLAGVASIVAERRVHTTWVVIAVLGVFALLFVRAQLRLSRQTYAITNRRLTIETGLLSRELHQARLERIQDVDVRQSALERALGIGTVDFYTAAEPGSGFSFRGVEDPRGIVRAFNGARYESGRSFGDQAARAPF